MATATVPTRLTAAEITAKLNQKGKKRNVHPPFVRQFIASGEPYWIANDYSAYKGLDFDDLKKKVQGIKAAVKTLHTNSLAAGVPASDLPTIEVVFVDDTTADDYGTLYIINMTVVNNTPSDES